MEMYKRQARLVTRMTEDGDGAIIGVAFKGQSFFKKGRVYEITEMLGEMIIKDIGPQKPNINWGHTLEDVRVFNGKYLYLTAKEYEEILDKERQKQLGKLTTDKLSGKPTITISMQYDY